MLPMKATHFITAWFCQKVSPLFRRSDKAWSRHSFSLQSLMKFVLFLNRLLESVVLFCYSSSVVSHTLWIFDLNSPRFALSPYLHLLCLILAAHFYVNMQINSCFLETPVLLRNIRFLHSTFTITRANVWWTLLPLLTQNLMFICC